MPPAFLECPRDLLTSYTGRVTKIEPRHDRTTIEIETDWDTVERVMIDHTGAPDARARYRLGGQPFPPDGAMLADSAAAAGTDIRATAWVCRDGTVPPLIDWHAPME